MINLPTRDDNVKEESDDKNIMTLQVKDNYDNENASTSFSKIPCRRKRHMDVPEYDPAKTN